jgi:hypothetical protein
MGSYSDTIDSIKSSLDGIKPSIVAPTPSNPAPKVPEPAWLAKIAKCGAELKTMSSGMTEQTKTYVATIIPQTIPNTTAYPNAGSLATAVDSVSKNAILAQDASKLATTLPEIVTMKTTINSMIDGAKTHAVSSLASQSSSLPTDRRKSQLYANDARAQISSTSAQVEEHFNLKKELVKF